MTSHTTSTLQVHLLKLAPAITTRLSLSSQVELEHMMQLGIIHPFSSAWSSPLHMVPKKTPGDGTHVVTTMLSIASQYMYLTAIRFHIYMTSPFNYKVKPSFQNLT